MASKQNAKMMEKRVGILVTVAMCETEDLDKEHGGRECKRGRSL